MTHSNPCKITKPINTEKDERNSTIVNAKADEPNEITYSAMDAAEKGENMIGPFCSVGELMKNLNK